MVGDRSAPPSRFAPHPAHLPTRPGGASLESSRRVSPRPGTRLAIEPTGPSAKYASMDLPTDPRTLRLSIARESFAAQRRRSATKAGTAGEPRRAGRWLRPGVGRAESRAPAPVLFRRRARWTRCWTCGRGATRRAAGVSCAAAGGHRCLWRRSYEASRRCLEKQVRVVSGSAAWIRSMAQWLPIERLLILNLDHVKRRIWE